MTVVPSPAFAAPARDARLVCALFDWFYVRLSALPVLNITGATYRLGVRVLADPHAKLARAAAVAFDLPPRSWALDVAFWATASALDRLWVDGVRRGPPKTPERGDGEEKGLVR